MRVLGKGRGLSSSPQRTPCWRGRGGDPGLCGHFWWSLSWVSSTPQPLPPSLVPDHLPLFPGLVTSDKESAAHLLSRKEGGNLLAIVVGGAQEALNARPGATTLLLRNRKGFVRLALMHGYPGRGLSAPREIGEG